MDFIAQCFGIDSKKHRYATEAGGEDKDEAIPVAILKTETHKSLKERAITKLKLKCVYCQQVSEFSGVYQDQQKNVSGMICPAMIKQADGSMKACGQLYPVNFIKNRVSLFLRQLLEFYYSGKSLFQKKCY